MSKLRDLDAALEALIEPGCSVHLTTQTRAAARAIQRVFRGRDMDLTLIMGRVGGGHAADLVASGLVRHVIAGSYGAVSAQYTGRLAQMQRVFASGKVRFESWTFLTLIQRLAAAAQGQPFALTHSMAGSTMARDNPHGFAQIDDPFGGGRMVNVVRALHPDVAVVHVDAADEDGNAILLPPFEEGAWAAKAARRGAIVTAERIVDAGFVRAHSHLVQLPGRYASAVVHLPFGAHPGAAGSRIVPGLRCYEEDEPYNAEYFAATRDPEALARWVDEWIHGPRDHAAYLRKLGDARLAALESAAAPAAPAGAASAASPPAASPAAASPNEIAMTLAMRHILRRQAERGYDLFLVGVGLSEVPATAAYTLLARQGAPVRLAMGHGYYGFEPGSGRSNPDASTSLLTTDALTVYCTLLGGRRGAALAILGAGQIDRRGNLNSTLIDGQLLTGSGGSNDAAATCDTLVVTRLARGKLVEQVEYVTCPGASVGAVITERGVFEKDASGTLVLASYSDPDDAGRDAALAQVAGLCGWRLEVVPELRREPPPTRDELALIRSLMPGRYG